MKRIRFGAAVLTLSITLLGCRSPDKNYQTIKKQIDTEAYDSALANVDDALHRYQARDDEWVWRFQILKARILVSRNQYNEALAVLDKDPPPVLARTDIAEQRWLYRGIAHRGGQLFLLAEKDFHQADEIVAVLGAPFRYQLLVAKADLEVDENKNYEAEANYKKALFMAREEKLAPSFEMNALGGLGRLATGQGHFDEAAFLNETALRLARSLRMQGSVATILGNTAWSYFQLGDFESSLDFYKQGAAASEQSGLAGNTEYWFTGVANSYIALQDYASAEGLAKRTLERAKKLNNAQTITTCLNTLTEIMLKTGRLVEAKRYNQEALEIEDSGSDTFGVPDSLIWAGHIAVAEKRFGDADQFFQRVLSGPSPNAPLRWQAEAGLAGVRDGEGKAAEAERMYRQAIDTIEKARQSINHDELRLSFLSSGIAVYGKYIDFLVRQGRSADAMNQAELSRARTLAEGLSSDGKSSSSGRRGVPPQQLAQRLRATLLFYWLGEEHSYLWVITPAKTTYFTLPAASEIGGLIKTYTQAIVDSKDVLTTGDRQTGEKLYATLVAPAQKFIPGNSRVILLPDETLYGLNFETLIVPEPQPHYWIEDVTLTTGSSLALLTSSTNRRAAKGKNLLLVGNPKEANPEFPPLLQAPNEMKKVGQHFPDSQRVVLEGERATPTSYLSSNPERFSYVHLATHGTASRTRPLESAVVLSKEPEGDSYKLYARDIVTRHLQAELVTISACYGSGRRAYSGEGLVGLSWAFVRAGAHNVIGALWEVSDVPATPEIMDALYRELGMGKDPAAALRSAKLSLLHSTKPNTVFRKPFYWAPFQLYAGS